MRNVWNSLPLSGHRFFQQPFRTTDSSLFVDPRRYAFPASASTQVFSLTFKTMSKVRRVQEFFNIVIIAVWAPASVRSWCWTDTQFEYPVSGREGDNLVRMRWGIIEEKKGFECLGPGSSEAVCHLALSAIILSLTGAPLTIITVSRLSATCTRLFRPFWGRCHVDIHKKFCTRWITVPSTSLDSVSIFLDEKNRRHFHNIMASDNNGFPSLFNSLHGYFSLKGTNVNLQGRPQNCEKRLLASSCLSARMEQLGSTGRTLLKFYVWEYFRKSVQKIQGSLKSDKNRGYFTWRPIHIFLSYLAHFFF